MRVKKCKKCGQDNYLDMKFCTACGNKFEDDDVDVKSDSNTNIVYCQNCGSKNSTDNKFCENCGAPLDEEIEDTTEEEIVQENEESDTTKEDKEQEVLDISTDIIYCQSCGSKNSTDNKFCESCGASLDEEVEETTEEEIAQEDEESDTTKENEEQEVLDTSIDIIYCQSCGSKNSTDNKFCESCGASLDEEVEETTEEEIAQEDEESEATKENEEQEVLDTFIDIIYCQSCGSKNSTDNKFCESCGASLDEEIEDTTEEEIVQEDEESEATKENEDQEEVLDNKSLIQENVSNDVKDKASLVKEQKRDKKQKNSKKIKISKKQMKIILLIIVILVFSTFTICFTMYQSKHSWSKWVSKLPTDVTDSKYVIEKKKQYSIKTKKTTTSSKETLKGWTLDKSNLPNAEELEKEISTIEEIKKFESNKDVTINNKEVIEEQYEAVLCGYYNPNETSNRFYTPNDSKPYCNKDDSYTLTENIANQPKDTYKIGDDYKDKYYTNTDGNKIYYKIVSSTPVKVKYKYSNKTTDSLYHFYKWTAWSEYSDKEQKASSTVKVRERIVYRYKVR